jgi:DNA-binding transcriptional MerR regulator
VSVNVDDIERYKADMARAREAGITFRAVRDIMSAHDDDGPDGESFGRMVERIRDLALQAAARMAEEERKEAQTMRLWAQEAAHAENLNAQDAHEERAAVVAWLRGLRAIGHGRELLTALADDIERGEHRRKEKP